jgi:tetratricopeptide (TPR) repeat protein
MRSEGCRTAVFIRLRRLHLASPLAVWIAWLTVSCSAPRSPATPGRNLLPVSLPELTRVDASVQEQVRQRYASLTGRIANSSASDPDLATAYGELGMVLQAAEYYDAAEPCYRNAQTLAPAELRWPYYLGHVYKSKGDTKASVAAFERALQLKPDDVSTLIWLGRLYLDDGRTDAAAPLFTRASTVAPRSAAVLSGLGRVSLDRRDYAEAARHFEEALAVDPEAASLHAPLATAYRGLGEPDKAAPHLREWKNRDIPVPDPLHQELDLLLESGLSYELRGVRALEGRDWKSAAEFFRKGLELAHENSPLRRSLGHKLGTALYMAGDVPGATDQFRQVIEAAPAGGIDESVAKAHYSLGLLLASSGRSDEAIEHLTRSVNFQPSYVEARLALADTLRYAGQPQPALAHYKEASAVNPRSVQAQLGYALALTDLRRYLDARAWLTEAVERQPDRPELAHMLARLLAAAPDDRVRDGRRAMEIVQQLLKDQKSTDLGETMAMAFAELGDYERAAGVQRGVMAAAREAGLQQAVRRMEENLRLYEAHRPCRTLWFDGR